MINALYNALFNARRARIKKEHKKNSVSPLNSVKYEHKKNLFFVDVFF